MAKPDIDVLRDMLAALSGYDVQSITINTRVYQDLGISGDDASELLEKIHLQFGTSFDGFRFVDYFPNETEALWLHWFRWLGLNSKKELTLLHLASVVESGRWSEPSVLIPGTQYRIDAAAGRA